MFRGTLFQTPTMKGLKKGPGSTPFALGLRPRSQGVEPGGMTHFIEYSQVQPWLLF